MKKIFGLMIALLLLNGCDDGDLTVDNLDFSTAVARRCSDSNIIYKLNDSEALFFEIPYDEAFINDATPEGAPLTFQVDATHRVFYRSYSGTVATDNICETIQPATPTVTQQWMATSGVIEIVTVPVKTANSVLVGGEKITKYRHTITFRNITFQKPDGNQLYETFAFGIYETTPTALPFAFDDEVDRCGDRIYNTSGSEAITLDIDPNLIQSNITAPGAPRTGLVSGTLNKVTYTLFNGLIGSDYLCASTLPASPVPVEVWAGVDGVDLVSGIVEVSTTTNGTGFLHEIHLKKVTLKRGNSEFLLADDYHLGNLITN